MNLLQFLKDNNGKPNTITWLELANMFNFKSHLSDKKRAKAANDIWRSYTRNRTNAKVTETSQADGNSFSYNVEKGEITVNTYYDNPPTPEQIIADHRINTNEYKLVNYYSKGKSQGWQVTANFKAVAADIKAGNNFIEFFQNYKAKELSFPTFNKKSSERNMLEISVPDLHLDKKGLEGLSIDEMSKIYFNIIQNLVEKATTTHDIEKIVFVTGNDFFNTDNIHNATALHMNVQEVNSYWHEAYTKGFDLLVNVISYLRSKCNNVEIISIPGNHAKSKEFYLAHALSAYFRNSDVTFDISPSPRKAIVYGETSIMYHHGNCKLDSLPTIMAQEFKKAWGSTKYNRIHVGDKHHFMEKEINGVIIKQFPSLSQTDTYHNENQFILNQRKALVLVHNYHNGLVATFERGI